MSKALTASLFLMIAAVAFAEIPENPTYNREEIRFSSGRFHLVGDLLTPPGKRPCPVIVYVWGAGPTNRTALIERSPLLKIFLAKGFGVLVYDKPGSGQSTGEFDNRSLFEGRAGILIDAVGFLKKHDAVDTRGIGLYGSSQASYVMAVALQRTKDVAFMIASSCPMESSIEQSSFLVRNYVLCAGGDPALADSAGTAYLQRGRARSYPEYRQAAEVLEGIPAIRDGLGWAGVVSKDDFTPANPTSESFLDPSTNIAALKIPILAVFAENDRQINSAQGAEYLRRLFSGSDRNMSDVVVIPGADHNMILSPRGCMQDQRDDYRSVGGRTVSPAFLQTVAGWLDRLSARMK